MSRTSGKSRTLYFLIFWKHRKSILFDFPPNPEIWIAYYTANPNTWMYAFPKTPKFWMFTNLCDVLTFGLFIIPDFQNVRKNGIQNARILGQSAQQDFAVFSEFPDIRIAGNLQYCMKQGIKDRGQHRCIPDQGTNENHQWNIFSVGLLDCCRGRLPPSA